jgi:hypothetical protein
VIRGTAALAASIICFTLVAMASSSFQAFKIRHAVSTVRPTIGRAAPRRGAAFYCDARH